MVYFASLPKPKRPKGRGEFARIEAFKRKYGQNALYHVYSGDAAFEGALRQQLAATMNKLRVV